MRQKRLMERSRIREDYPQINYIDKRGVQWIELNRGCKRQCPFCYADPNFKEFPIPDIVSNKVQIIGEGILFDKNIRSKIWELGEKRVNKRVVYYGLSQGVDYRLLNDDLIDSLAINRFGLINNKGNWSKGLRIAWDWGIEQEAGIIETIKSLINSGYKEKSIIVFVLCNWRITYYVCLYKLEKLKELGIRIDDCYYDTTKRLKLPFYWSKKHIISFRRKCRKHNQLITFNGYDPELNK